MVSTGKMLAFINALGGGSGPSDVVILPETEMTAESVADDLATFSVATPPNAYPEVGKAYAVTLNGVAYDITAIEFDGSVLLSHDLASPSFVIVFLTPEVAAHVGAYVVVEASPAVGESITLSIVEKAETASAGGGLTIVNATPTGPAEVPGAMYAVSATVDKTCAEIRDAIHAGENVVIEISPFLDENDLYRIPVCQIDTFGNASASLFINPEGAFGALSVFISAENNVATITVSMMGGSN